MQTILGSSGSVGTYLAKALAYYNTKVKLVSRNPEKVFGDELLHKADLMKYDQVLEAVKGSDIVYLTVGLKYNTLIWEQQWPVLLRNVIDACKVHGAKLVYFDNTYMYGKVEGWITEDKPFNPCSKKGEVRARLATMLLDEIKSGNITALIARSADLYGPYLANSYIHSLVLHRVYRSQKAFLLTKANRLHSYTFIFDAAEGMARLANTPSAFGQTWHLPTDHRVLTVKQMISTAVEPSFLDGKSIILPPWRMKLASLFNPLIEETIEMIYLYESDYLFNSKKFDLAFPNFRKTTYKEGLAEVMETLEY